MRRRVAGAQARACVEAPDLRHLRQSPRSQALVGSRFRLRMPTRPQASHLARRPRRRRPVRPTALVTPAMPKTVHAVASTELAAPPFRRAPPLPPTLPPLPTPVLTAVAWATTTSRSGRSMPGIRRAVALAAPPSRRRRRQPRSHHLRLLKRHRCRHLLLLWRRPCRPRASRRRAPVTTSTMRRCLCRRRRRHPRPSLPRRIPRRMLWGTCRSPTGRCASSRHPAAYSHLRPPGKKSARSPLASRWSRRARR
mmetsp:Transcript_30699/g.102148  ORF Transcript_30699/g.102148 Transcript_30699/m.102148 type:complete len:252 (-) Transcript_30699:2881-3636(-)